MKAGIIVFPATNCDADTKRACEFFGWDVEYIWHSEKIKKHYDVIFLPGGFSYGDYISAGRIAKFSPAVETLPLKESLIVGICNGFQILCETKLLPGALTDNISCRFLSEPAVLYFNNKEIVIPIAHFQGNYTIKKMPDCEILLKYKNNKNGSDFDIAGIYDREKRIIGMMPHPERAVFQETGFTDGRQIFEFIKNEC